MEPLKDTWPQMVIMYSSNYSFMPVRMQIDGPESVELFNFEEKAVFAWDENSQKFLISPASQLTTSDIEAFFFEGSAYFLKRHHKDVVYLYHEGSDLQQQWAKQVLKQDILTDE